MNELSISESRNYTVKKKKVTQGNIIKTETLVRGANQF